jgi:hypothetical protein
MNSTRPTDLGATSDAAIRRARIGIGIFIAGLVLNGLTAFPLAGELRVAAHLIGAGGGFHGVAPAGLQEWIVHVRDGLADTYTKYPWVGYGTDWFGFAHLIVALFFVPAWRDPVHHVGTLRVGIVACLLVLPFALIAGPLRGVPFSWRLVDCFVGLLGIVPLAYALQQVRPFEPRST